MTSLNLSNFDTSGVTEMVDMFSGCSSLTSLDLSNFVHNGVSDVRSMFKNCINLEYINLNNSNIYYFRDYNNIFEKVPNNIVICLLINNEYMNELYSKYCYTIDCSKDWKSNQKKMIDGNKCIKNCFSDDQYKYEYNGNCLKNCTKGFINFSDNFPHHICKCELEKCLLCPPVALNKNLCIKCNENYYPKQNDPSNIGEYINCYKSPTGYYLDESDSLYKKCYDSCETCEIKGDYDSHNCLTCNKDFEFFINFTKYKNCYKKCEYYYYIDNEKNYHCTTNSSCPREYPKLIKEKMECVFDNEIITSKTSEYIKEDSSYFDYSELTKEISNKIIEIQNNTKITNISNIIKNMIKFDENKTRTKEEENMLYDNILITIEDSFTSELYDTTKLDNGENNHRNVKNDSDIDHYSKFKK